jgi:dephospho-CoA kinase
MSGSGKTTLARYAEEMGYEVTTMGDVIRDIAKERGLEPTPRNLDQIAEGIRRERGDAAVAERCIESMRKEEAPRVVVDGIRSLEEVEVFRRAFNDTMLLAAHASPRTRFHRLKARGRSDDPGDWEAFSRRDRRELGFGVGSAIAMVDYMLVNEGSLKDLKRDFDRLMERLNEV